jgi:hypothetical protein
VADFLEVRNKGFPSEPAEAHSGQGYEAALDLNVWNQTQIISSKWEADKKYWLVEVERYQDGKKTRSGHADDVQPLRPDCSPGH